MKNKKLWVTAIAAAIVLSMQATTVFAGEVSDSDLDIPAVTSVSNDETENDADLTTGTDDSVTETEDAEIEDSADDDWSGEKDTDSADEVWFGDEDTDSSASDSADAAAVEWDFDMASGELLVMADGALTQEQLPDWSSISDHVNKVVFNDGVTDICAYALPAGELAAEGLPCTTVEIPASVTDIASGAFYNNRKLERIEVDSGNTYYSSQDGVLFTKDMTTLIAYPQGKTDESYTVPDSVTVIGESAFLQNVHLKEVTLPNSVEAIGPTAFMLCQNLESIVIPHRVTEIEASTFSDCAALTEITLPKSLASVGGMAFECCDSLTDVYYEGTEDDWNDIDISASNPELLGATVHYDSEVASYLADDSEEEPSMTAEDVQSLIDGYAEKYKTVPGVEDEDVDAFRTLLTDTLEQITSSEQFDNDDITYDNVAEYFEEIYDRFVYAQLESLTDGKCGENLTWSFDGESGVLTVSGDGDMYEAPEEQDEPDYEYFGWQMLSGDITEVRFEGNITSIAPNAFAYSSCETIDIPASVERIGADAFGWCEKLTAIHVAEDNAHYCSVDGVLFNKDKTELIIYPASKADASYTVPDTVKTVADDAFGFARNLKKAVIPDSVTSLGETAFMNCRRLTDVTIGNSVTVIKDGTFEYCPQLETVTLGNSVQKIGDMAFASSGLGKLTIPHWIKSFGSMAFDESNLTDITYIGTEEEWNAITPKSQSSFFIIETNSLENINIHFAPADNYTEPAPYVADEDGESDDFFDDITLTEEDLADLRESIDEMIAAVQETPDIAPEEVEDIVTFLNGFYDQMAAYQGKTVKQEEIEAFFREYIQKDYEAAMAQIPTSGQCGENLTWSFDRENGMLTISGDGDMYDYLDEDDDEIPDEEINEDDDWDIIEEDISDEDEEVIDMDEDEDDVEDGMTAESLTEDFFAMYGNDEVFAFEESYEDTEEDTDEESEEEIDEESEEGTDEESEEEIDEESEEGTDEESLIDMFMAPWMILGSGVKGVQFVGNVTSIGSGAFFGMPLPNIEIPASIVRIGKDALAMNPILQSVTVDKDNTSYTDVDGVLFNKDMSELLLYPARKQDESYTIPETVKTVADGAFCQAGYLTKVVIPDTVESFGERAFAYCAQLKEVVIGNGVKEIPNNAFTNCGKLSKVFLGNAVEEIDENAFSETALTEITLPASVKHIDTMAFWGTELDDVYYQGTEAQWAQVLNDYDETVEIEDATMHYLDAEKSSDDQKSDGEAVTPNDTDNTKGTDSKNVTNSPATGEATDTLPLLAMLASMGSMAVALILSKLRKLKGE